MYINAFQSCITVARKVCTNLFTHSAQYKSVNLDVIVSRQAFRVPNYSLTRCYCAQNRSEKTAAEYYEKYKAKLNQVLEDPENLLHFNKLKLEIEVMRHSSERVPEDLSPYNWLMLFSTKSRIQRRNYVEYLWKLERKDENRQKAKESKRQEKPSTMRESADMNKYGLHNNTMFLRIYDTTMIQLDNRKLMNAMMYEPPIVFDLGYEDYMTPNEAQNCAKQLALSFSLNRAHIDPFNLYFCNSDKSNFIMQKVHQTIPTVFDIDFPLNITSKSYLDIFDKNDLVYLTPHTNNIMNKYDPNKVYIIGAMVDKMHPQPISLVKAKKEGIKMARFPLAEYLEWGSGSAKNLPLNQVLSILLDLRYTNDWCKAFQHVPKRKLRIARETVLQKKLDSRSKMIELLSKSSDLCQ